MVKVTKEAAQQNHQDLVRATGQMMRAQGVSVATVANIAAHAGLTHGAIYRHFSSKDDLAAAAISADFDTIVALVNRIGAEGGSLADYFRAYLAADHRDHFVWGCPVAPLAAEIGRTVQPVKAAFAEGLARNLAAIAALSGITDEAEARSYAISALATLSGAMAMARATRGCEPETSQQILEETLRTLLADPRIAGRAQVTS
ncbi:TetR/AcrR family transcriptional regulator [Tabrizicola sp.]|uniref:TetR/AcrR family transcriptional regulator n=1 Tax=Tabrizicola sp. TaxID=2005166 RepID=UPI002734C11E|nr:TetR/AcrR family transcriptional regulator [Tabrizicola sp.]MDP3196787.1 TetR family transcriptional regulator [Tabrizicola sp.]